jgi:DNA invertase Pin-like site-specific DNA recombinase
MGKTKRAALYVRVSTDRQTVENQIQALTAIAEHRGWQIVATYSDKGISGAKGRKDRPSFDQMLVDAGRGKFDVVMAWALDRVGRSLSDLLATIKHLEACKADLFIDKELIDTTSPTGMLLFHITGAFAQFERSLIVNRVNAGLVRALAAGTKLGRPRIDATTESAIRAALERGDKGKHKIAAEFGVGSGTVARIRAEMAGDA